MKGNKIKKGNLMVRDLVAYLVTQINIWILKIQKYQNKSTKKIG